VRRFDLGAWPRKKNDIITKKVTKVLYFPYLRETPTGPIRPKSCMMGDVPNVITCAKFQIETFMKITILQGSNFRFSYWFLHVPVIRAVGPKTINTVCGPSHRCTAVVAANNVINDVVNGASSHYRNVKTGNVSWETKTSLYSVLLMSELCCSDGLQLCWLTTCRRFIQTKYQLDGRTRCHGSAM